MYERFCSKHTCLSRLGSGLAWERTISDATYTKSGNCLRRKIVLKMKNHRKAIDSVCINLYISDSIEQSARPGEFGGGECIYIGVGWRKGGREEQEEGEEKE